MMKNDKRQVKTRFGPEVGFEVKPVQVRAAQTTELGRLKERLLDEQLAPVSDPDQENLVRQAAEDAASLAWNTGHPLLFFPGLFEEKARMAARQARRQREIWRRSLGLILEAA